MHVACFLFSHFQPGEGHSRGLSVIVKSLRTFDSSSSGKQSALDISPLLPKRSSVIRYCGSHLLLPPSLYSLS